MSISAFKPITHIIYDLDGLLLDTEAIHAHVNQTLATRYGKTFDHTIHTKIIGRTAPDSAQIIIESLALPLTVDTYLAQRDVIIHDLYSLARPMPGAIELTEHLYRNGIKQAIATSSSQKTFRLKTQHYQDWLTRFHCIVLGDDSALRQGKPAPDCFLIAAERLHVTPDQCLVFEDSIAGVTAAKAAGMSVIAIPAPDMDYSLFQNADQILNSLLDFQPEQWHLPTLKHHLL